MRIKVWVDMEKGHAREGSDGPFCRYFRCIASSPCDVMMYRACMSPYSRAAERDSSSVSVSLGERRSRIMSSALEKSWKRGPREGARMSWGERDRGEGYV